MAGATAPSSPKYIRIHGTDVRDPTRWWAEQSEFMTKEAGKVSTWDAKTKRGNKIGGTIRIAIISDTHGMHADIDQDSIPIDTDILVHAGDITNVGEPAMLHDFVDWVRGLRCKPAAVVVIAGNHDISLDEEGFDDRKKRLMPRALASTVSVEETQGILVSDAAKAAGIVYLRNESTTILGYKFFGSPESAFFYDWAFNVDRGDETRDLYHRIPSETDVLITHGPPTGHGDQLPTGQRVGDVHLLTQVERRIRPLLHVFGHIHEGYGVTVSGPIEGSDDGGGGDEVEDEDADGAATGGGHIRKTRRVGEAKGASVTRTSADAFQVQEPSPSVPLLPRPGRVTYVNGSTCTFSYRPTNPPIVVDLPSRVPVLDVRAGTGTATGAGTEAREAVAADGRHVEVPYLERQSATGPTSPSAGGEST